MNPTRRRGLAATILLVLVSSACGSAGVVMPERPRTDVPAVPEIVSLTADPVTVVEGESAVLSWEVSDANATLRLAPLGLAVVGDSIEVAPVVTTTYTLTATNAVGITFKDVTVSVVPRSSGSRPNSESATANEIAVGAAEWVPATGELTGMVSECGTLSYVSADPRSSRVIAGIAQKGLWSLGADGTWSQLGQGAGSDTIVNRTSSIVWDPTAPERFWESGAYNSGGVYRSDDGGQTFTQLGDLTHLEFISVDFSDESRRLILAAEHETAKLWRSTTGGETWENLTSSLPDGIGWAESPVIIDDQTYLLGSWRGTRAGVYRTTNGGQTWDHIIEYGVIGQPVVAEAEGALYWLLENQEGMIRSTDGGLNWELLRGPESASSKSALLLPDGRIATIGSGTVITTSDQGQTWDSLGPELPFEPNGFTYSPGLNAFFAWRFECNNGTPNTVAADAIVRLDLEQPLTQAVPPSVVTGATTTSTTTG